ncbi:probable inactive shikimate kinase like 2, chloroplastic [Olea europaea subsp. europaea]|uniref:Probable inactive shikimate kinase like 2, chloroplastic n=2 Tax=Olea europaea subsp. europaea TaxID=158383 RepID=A0A8S0QYR0_OLEEU|nr:probable inactive shikimate kinase like 2, chloroplastic [Olea europaea subsp. europaea]
MRFDTFLFDSVELRLELGKEGVSPKEIFIDANENSLVIKVQNSGYLRTLLDTNKLYGMIKPFETIWYIDDDQLVVNLKKQDPELKCPDIMESWESLTAGVAQLLRGTSIYLAGESTEINHKIARELAVGLGYTPLNTKEILESYSKEIIDSWVASQGCDAVAEAETAILESLSSHARAVVSTLGGKHGAAERPNKWQHLFTGFTIWLSQSKATDEESVKEETRRHLQDGLQGYSNAEVVVKLGGWDANYSKAVAQASLSALKHLILSDKNLPGKKSLYRRLGCRGDWPDIKPPSWDPSTGSDASSPLSCIEGGAKWLVNKLKGKMQKPLLELLKEYDMAIGIFPRDATNYEFNEETGKLTVYIPSVCEVGYRDSSVLRFSTVVTGYLEKGKLADIEGIKTKVMIWVKVTAITCEKSKLHFTAGMKKTRSRDAYEVLRDGVGVDKF